MCGQEINNQAEDGDHGGGLQPVDRAVVLDVDLSAGLLLNRADHLAAGPDDGADLVEIAPAYDPIGGITAVAGATLGGDILYLLSEALRR